MPTESWRAWKWRIPVKPFVAARLESLFSFVETEGKTAKEKSVRCEDDVARSGLWMDGDRKRIEGGGYLKIFSQKYHPPLSERLAKVKRNLDLKINFFFSIW
jgi:hypothetical protein